MDSVDKIARRLVNSSVLWGGIATMVSFAALQHLQASAPPWMVRCLLGHWEAYVCVALFFIGTAFVILRAADIIGQLMALQTPLVPRLGNSERAEYSPELLLTELQEHAPASPTNAHTRLHLALQHISRTASTEPINDYLRNLAAADREKLEERYSLVRFAIWAIPSVGCLGTVLGIAKAVSQLTTTQSPELVAGVTRGLAEAFDTFALSLGLSIMLVLFKFLAERGERRLLTVVDEKVENELSSVLGELDRPAGSQADQFRVMIESTRQLTEKLARLSARPPAEASERGREVDDQKMEAMVARAVGSAIGQLPSGGGAAPGNIDPASWKSLQRVLQQLATVLSRQEAKQESEGQVLAQLLEIIDEKDREVINSPPPSHHSSRADEAKTIALWK